MAWTSLLLLLCLAIGCHAQTLEEKIQRVRKGNLADMPRQPPPPESGMSRFLHFEYSFKSETVLYDILPNKAASPSTFVEAKLTFDILGHGDGGTLGKWELVECLSGNCGSPPPVYVSFRRGGNNLVAVHVDPKDMAEPSSFVPRWNLLYAVIHHIYTPAESGEGDEQYVKTPYGLCNVLFTRPEDKRFRRQMSGCDMKGALNHTRIAGLLPLTYSNDVHYLQNTKFDADIVIIDSVEQLTVGSPFDDRFGVAVETRTHMEMDNRTVEIKKRICDVAEPLEKCTDEVLGLRKVGERVYEDVAVAAAAEEEMHKLELDHALSSLRSLHSDSKSWEGGHSSAFSSLLLSSSSSPSSISALSRAMVDDDNYDIRGVIASALGALGGVESITAAKETIFAPESSLHIFEGDFFFGVAHNLRGEDDKWLKQLAYWMMELKKESSTRDAESSTYWKLSTALATALRRDCERTPSSQNACKTGKRQIVTKFISELTEGCEDAECREKALTVLLNLPVSGAFDWAKGTLCSPSSSSAAQLRALHVIERAPTHLYNGELVSLLIRIFRNTCPRPSTTGESMAALDVLLRSIPDQQNAATLLLRTEHPLSPADHELWAYLYDAVARSRLFDGAKDDFWARLRGFRLFRPNYSQRSLVADSNAFGTDIMEFSGFRGRFFTSSEFASGLFKASQLSFNAIRRKGTKNLEDALLHLSLESSGLESYVDSAQSLLEPSSPKASVLLSLLGHTLPPFVGFSGHQELMSAAMGANGQTIRAFEGTVPLRLHSTSLPLLSGLSLSLSSSASSSVRLFGSVELSLWARASTVQIHVNTSSSLSSTASLLLDGVEVSSLSSSISLLSAVSSVTEAKFAAAPYRFCVNTGNTDSVIELSTERVDTKGHSSPKIEKSGSSRHIPGVSWNLGDAITGQCKLFLHDK